MNHFNQNLAGIPENSKLLLAVSGGIDSMVLLDLFSHRKFAFSIAHCNFQLRADESDGDEHMLREWANSRSINIHVQGFNLEKEHPGKGIQEAARIARYKWFEELRLELNYDFIVTAHHQNDQAETIVFNFLRGAALAGLSGMKTLDGRIFRPLIQTKETEIEDYQKQHNIIFREDSSNANLKYSRNKIRHQLLPILEEYNPNISTTLTRQADIFLEAHEFILQEVKSKVKECTEKRGEELWIDISKLSSSGVSLHILQHLLSPKGFSSQQIRQINQLAQSQSGKLISNQEWQVHRDHSALVLHPCTQQHPEVQYFHKLEDLKKGPFNVSTPNIDDVDFSQKHDALLDLELVEYPLILRTWRDGDRFQPLGMHGHQKISDFLTHEKVSSIHKKEQQVLCQGEQIIWVLGKRIDDRFKLKENSKSVLHLTLRK